MIMNVCNILRNVSLTMLTCVFFSGFGFWVTLLLKVTHYVKRSLPLKRNIVTILHYLLRKKMC